MQPTRASATAGNAYRGYVLLVLMLVYMFNFLDRQILSILAESIKADLHISDTQMGFLLGTSFAVFYAIFAIPLGRAADLVRRTGLISSGLLLWSLMTSLSGFAGSFTSLATCRMLVGVGEASASPAVYSMLYDYFPERLRTTALAIYSSGIFIGAGLGLSIGGLVMGGWAHLFPDPATAPWGLKGWQAAFILVGSPGVLMAVWVASLREPIRGALDGREIQSTRKPFGVIGEEMATLLPGAGLIVASRHGGSRAALINVAVLAVVASCAMVLIRSLGGELQWVTLGLGAYVFATWCQKLWLTDRESFASIFGCPPLVLGSLGFTGCFFLTMGALSWLAVFFQRHHGAPASEVGLTLGLSYAIAGFLGVTAGGLLTDRIVASYGGRGRLWVAAGAVTLATLSMAALLLVDDKWTAYGLSVPFNFFSAMYVAPGAANVNSLVPARIRATASGAYIVCQVLLGTALGPYVVGAISDALTAQGMAPGDALRQAMLLSLLASIPAIVLLLIAAHSLRTDAGRQVA